MKAYVLCAAFFAAALGQTQLLYQDFDTTWTTNSPPAGWRIFHTDTTVQGTDDWHRRNVGSVPWAGHGSPYAAIFWNVHQDRPPDSLVSPVFDCRGLENVTLRCSTHFFRKWLTGFQASLVYSVDGGVSFPYLLMDYATVDSFEGEEVFLLEQARNRNNVVLAWVFDDSLYNINWWCLDDVRVEGDTMPEWDVGCAGIQHPGFYIQPGLMRPRARFTNLGQVQQVDVPVACSLYDNMMTPLAGWLDTVNSMQPGQSRNVNFSPAYDMAEGDSYFIRFWCAADSDYNRANDTLDRYFGVGPLHLLSYCDNAPDVGISWPVGHHGWGVKLGLPTGVQTTFLESLQVYLSPGTGPLGDRYQLAVVCPDSLGLPGDVVLKTPVLSCAQGWNSRFMAETGEHLAVYDSFYVFYLQVGEPPECPELGLDGAVTAGAQYWRWFAGTFVPDSPPGDLLIRAWVHEDIFPQAAYDARCLCVVEPGYEFVQRPYDAPLQVKARIENHGLTLLQTVAVMCSLKAGSTTLHSDSVGVSNLAPGQDSLVEFRAWVDILPHSKRCSLIVRTVVPDGQNPDTVPENDDKRYGFDLLKGAFTGTSGLGFEWVDSDTVGGPAFAWIDTMGADIVMSTADDLRMFVDFGFDFPYYDTAYEYGYVCSNGWLLFGADQQTNTPTPLILPDPRLPNNAVYAYWADLRFGTGHGGGRLYRKMGGVPPTRFCAFIWQNVLRVGTADTTDRLSFEIVLHENGDIVFQYLDVEAGDPWFDNGKYAGFGLEDMYGADGLTYLYACPPMSGAVNDPANRIAGSRAILFRYLPSGVEQAKRLCRAVTRPPTVVRHTLLLPTSQSDCRHTLFDLTGREVMELRPGDNDIRHVAPGVYFVRSADSGARPAVTKVVVQR